MGEPKNGNGGGEETPRLRGRIRWWVTGPGVVITMLGAVTIAVLALFYGMWSSGIRSAEDFKDKFDMWVMGDLERSERLWAYFKVTIAFRGEGQEHVITRTFACRPSYTYPPGTQLFHQELLNRWMGKRLLSGAAVLFPVSFDLCWFALRRAPKPGKPPRVLTPRSARYLPPVLWLDDAVNPRVIEAYVSETYYEGPSPRVRVRYFEARTARPQPPSDPREDIGWLGKTREAGTFHALCSTVVPRSVWSRNPRVSALLNARTSPGILPRDAHITTAKSGLRPPSKGMLLANGTSIPLKNRPLPRGYDMAAYQANRRVYPVRLKNGRSVLELGQPGLILFYRRDRIPRKLMQVDLWVPGWPMPVKAKRSSWWQYDPASGRLYSLDLAVLLPRQERFKRFDRYRRRYHGR